ncbi:hypothetical protein GCM10010218_21360 [Streptomyces mashuensis]|uniref:Lasso RiPP family leader peptide-containing protein n=1 Tax=Streptomyces mashuensis TaxID=33904 RepID=A0A919ECB9_9ACTN|nr:keywimysin-related RiPP [Streptomyces mashuensis]GHF39765.1 hypothetical protein GCM10010218_21360 [Streptomyces mashuensis]
MNDERADSRELQAYEAPEMFEAGSFAEDTGILGIKGVEPVVNYPKSWW